MRLGKLERATHVLLQLRRRHDGSERCSHREHDRKQANERWHQPGEASHNEHQRAHGHCLPLPGPLDMGREGSMLPPLYSMLAQRISCPSPIGQKRIPVTFLLKGPNHFVL